MNTRKHGAPSAAWVQWGGCAALLLAGLSAMGAAQAHGEAKAQHGGVVQMAQDVGFELVAGPQNATLYLSDHGQPLATQGIRGKLVVMQGGKTTEAPLAPGGGNALIAQGLKLGPGATVVALVNPVAGKAVTVRFVLK